MNDSRHDEGFTLIELMIGITILAISLMLGIPSFSEWIQNSQIRTTASSMQAGLQKARMEAIRRNALVEFRLSSNLGNAGGTGWSIHIASTATEIESQPDAGSSSGITVSALPGTATRITFDGSGRGRTNPATNLDGSALLTQIDVDTTKLSAAASRDLRVVIGTGGSIRLCDPDPKISSSDDPRKC